VLPQFPRYVRKRHEPPLLEVGVEGSVDLVVTDAAVGDGFPRSLPSVAPAPNLDQAGSSLREHHLGVSGAIYDTNGVQNAPLVFDDAPRKIVINTPDLHPEVDVELTIHVPLVVLPYRHHLVLPVPTNTIDDVLFALQELLDEHTLVHDTEAVDRAVDLVEASLHLLLTVTEEDVVASSRLVGLHDDLVRVRVPVPQENLGGVPVTSYGLLNSPDPGLPNGLPHDVLIPPR